MTQDRLETSWNWRPMVGSAVATMVWSSAARNIASIRLTRMVRTRPGSAARAARSAARPMIAMTSVGISASSASISSANAVGFGRQTALPFVLVHVEMFVPERRQSSAEFAVLRLNLGGKHPCEAAPCGAWVHPAAQPSRSQVDRPNGSGLRALLQPRPLRQQDRPAHDMVLEIGVGDVVLGSLHPAAHGNAGLMNRVGIARYQRMPPIEVAPLGDEAVAAARRQPVQGADVLRRQPDAIGNLVGAVRIVLAGAQARIEQLAGDMGEVDLARYPRPPAFPGSSARSRRTGFPIRRWTFPPTSWFSRKIPLGRRVVLGGAVMNP